MSPDRFERIQRLFEEVCELSPGERAAFLERECGPDKSLRSEIEDLLAAADNSQGLFVDASNAYEVVGNPGEPSPQVFQVGETLSGRFRIVRYIGRGGMGEVYEAEDRDLGENVAIKTLRSHLLADRAHRARLLREVNVSRKVKHPNLCKIHDVGHDRTDGRETVFLTMELIEGETLEARLRRTGALALEEALPIIHDLALGLEVLHDHHIVHRDFKPANVILTHGEGSDPRPVITDFGLAYLTTAVFSEHFEVTQPGQIVGTPDYMAPEHLAGQQVGSWSDVYAFGIVTCEMLTGTHPFRSARGDVESKDLAERMFSRLPGGRVNAIRRCLSAIPSERPVRPMEVFHELSSPANRTPETGTDGSSTRSKLSQWARFRRWRFSVAVSAVLLALFSVGLRTQWQEVAELGVVVAIQESLCARFAGLSRFCPLPEDLDIAFHPLDVSAQNDTDRALGVGLLRFIGESLYRLRSDKGEFCFHLRSSKPHVGAALVLSGELQVRSRAVNLTTKLTRAIDGSVLRERVFRRRLDELHLLHEGLIRDIAELIGYELEPEAMNAWLAEGPKDVAAYRDYLIGMGLLEDGEYEQAATRFRSAQTGPQGGLAFAVAARRLGDARRLMFSETGEPIWAQQATNSYRQAEISPSVDLYRSWGILEEEVGDRAAALKRYQTALDIDPYDRSSRIRLVHSYEALGDRDSAEAALDAAVQLQPDCWLTRNFMAQMQMQYGLYRESEKSLLHVIRLAPRNPVPYNNLAYLYLTEGRYEDVVSWSAKAIEIIDDPRYFLTLGLGYLYRDCLDDALLNFRHAIDMDPSYYRSWYRLAEALLIATGQSRETRDVLQETVDLAGVALAESPGQRHAYCAASRALALLGDAEQALAHLAKLQALAPAEEATALCAAKVHDALGSRDDTLASLREALDLGATPFSVMQTPLSDDVRADQGYSTLMSEHGDARVLDELLQVSKNGPACPQRSVPGLAFN